MSSPLRIVAHARRSDARDDNESIGSQLQTVRRSIASTPGWIEAPGVEPVAIDGASGVWVIFRRRGEELVLPLVEELRPDLARLLELRRQGLIDGVDTKNDSRLHRNGGEFDIWLAMARQLGLRVFAGGKLLDDGTPETALLRRIIGATNQNYPEQVSRNVRQGKAARRARGYYVQNPVYGTMSPNSERAIQMFSREERESGVPLKDPDTWPWLLWLFEQAARRRSWNSIAGELNERSLPAPRGGLWSARTVRVIVSNRFYLGEVKYQGRSLEGVSARHSCRVPEALWEAAQQGCKGRRKGMPPLEGHYLLRGLGRSGEPRFTCPAFRMTAPRERAGEFARMLTSGRCGGFPSYRLPWASNSTQYRAEGEHPLAGEMQGSYLARWVDLRVLEALAREAEGTGRLIARLDALAAVGEHAGEARERQLAELRGLRAQCAKLRRQRDTALDMRLAAIAEEKQLEIQRAEGRIASLEEDLGREVEAPRLPTAAELQAGFCVVAEAIRDGSDEAFEAVRPVVEQLVERVELWPERLPDGRLGYTFHVAVSPLLRNYENSKWFEFQYLIKLKAELPPGRIKSGR